MAKREKRPVLTGITREKMEAAFAEYAKASARKDEIIAKRELQIAKLREKTQDEEAALDEAISANGDILQAFALENKDEMFVKTRSLSTTHGRLGFRIGTPKLKTLKGYTWESVKNLVKTFMPDYIRTSEEVAKDLLLAERENQEVSAKFKQVGVYVDQDESFFIEIKKEEEITA